jgi:Zn-dependent protease with chaperone function
VQLHFRRAGIGPNAFALPDGSIIVTDDLVDMLQDREDVMLGVLGHELGHISLRHALRALVQTGLLGMASGVVLGDFSSLLSAAPALMGHLAYSRDFEREADEASISFMRANGIRPSVMAVFFQRMDAYRRAKEASRQASDADGSGVSSGPLGIALSSHPGDAERVARFKAADFDDRAHQSWR